MFTQPAGTQSSPLHQEDLARLRVLVHEILDSHHGVPHARFVALAREVEIEDGITIDFRAIATFGSPLVILRPAAPAVGRDMLPMISPRERTVAGLIAEGLCNKEIAARLSISLATVKDHVHHILEKAELPNCAAVATAYSNSDDGSRRADL